MKNGAKRISALMLVISIFVCSLSITVGAAPEVYSKDTNSGTRHEVCVSLDGTSAEDYYKVKYDYETLSELSPDSILIELRHLMTETHTYMATYDNCRDYATRTDCENNDRRISLIYTSFSASMSDYTNNVKGGWNREHVWPKSLGGFNTTGAGADLHHIRPSDSRVNSTRNNNLYGNAQDGKEITGTSVTDGSVGGYLANGIFEPNDNVKGDVARICLYVYVRYGGEIFKCNDITNVFESIDVLLEWCEEDPVDTWEMGRNEVVEKIQGNRNVFIDYPEYAWLIFGEELPDTVTPSGIAKLESASRPDVTQTSAPEPDPPESSIPESDIKETSAPETNAPESGAPETNAPESGTSETKAPESGASETKAPESEPHSTTTPTQKTTGYKMHPLTVTVCIVSLVLIVGIVITVMIISKKKNK